MLWLSFTYHAGLLQTVTTYLFTLFSHVLWPLFVPFAVRAIEPQPRRRAVMLWFQFAGAALFLLGLIVALPLSAVANEHIIYVSSPHFYQWTVMALYIAATYIVSL